MKISEAKAAYSSQMQTLWAQKRALTEALKEQAERGMVQLLPGVHETDGFFFAKLRKK